MLLYLSNELCHDVYPQNTSGEFTNYLHTPLQLNGSVALKELYYQPNSWYLFRSTNNKFEIKIDKAPLLRVIPATVHAGGLNAYHVFKHLQFCKLHDHRIDSIKIRLCENVEGTILHIHGNVYACLEFQNA